LIGATAAVVVIAIGIFLATRDSEPPAVSIPEAPMATDSAAPVDLSDEAAATQGFELAAPSATETVKESTSLPQAAETVPATRDIFLEATESAWTEIKDAKGAVLFTGMLKQGQKLPIPDQAGMTLSTGNAGGVRLVISGTAQSTIGAAGEIKRQIALDPLLATHDKTN
jgi:cytoskeleton protein RodZ